MTAPIETYFAAGSTLANMVNLETVISSPSVLEAGRVPSVAPLFSRALDGLGRRDGKIPAQLKFTDATDSERQALNTLLFASQSVASMELYMSLLADDGHYNPYLVIADRPYEMEHYAPFNDAHFNDGLRLPLFDCRIQSVAKSANATITTSEHLVYVDTTGGSRTMTLPALSGVNEGVVYSFLKVASGNSLILDGSGSETIDGATTKTATALNARMDIVKFVSDSGATQWVSI